MHFLAPGQQPPPKPQRTFAASPGTAAAGLIMIQGPPPRPAVVQSSLQANNTNSLPYHQNRPLPDRPYSVAGHYPTIDRIGTRLSYPGGASANTTDFSGYLSSPEHRPSAAMIALHSGQPRVPFTAFSTATRPFEMVTGTGGPDSHSAIYGARPGQNPALDQESRLRMQEMERQIASLTNVVSKALSGNQLERNLFSY